MDDNSLREVFGDVIDRYTRAQAIADGVLVDVTGMAKEAGFIFPVALTDTVYNGYVHVPERLKGQQDEAGRLWDVLNVLLWAVRSDKITGDWGLFKVLFLMQEDHESRAHQQAVTLKAVCGPNDDASPCITIMLPEED